MDAAAAGVAPALLQIDSGSSRLVCKGAPLTPQNTLDALMAVILSRRANPSEKSYTATLLAGGVDKIGRKITEEAGEVVEAAAEAGEEGRRHLIHEAADLVYHLWVMLAHRDVPLSDLEAELARRFGTSGLEEKAAR